MAPLTHSARDFNILAIVIAAQFIHAQSHSNTCSNDGLYPDYETQCREYYRCTAGGVAGRYSCNPGRAFSSAEGACVPMQRQPCIRRECDVRDRSAYATPGTACRHYYRCVNGTSVDHACPSGAWFDLERQACSRGAGTCYEPLCTGLPDGDYPDTSHECRRRLRCRGGDLSAVLSCKGKSCASQCPPPRSSSVPLPAGDADFCSDEACSSLCQQAADGAYADRSTGCREYFVCEARRVIRRGVCEPGLLFSEGGCEPASRAVCPPPALSPCFNRADGPHRDWRDCSSWFECRRERVVSRGTCGLGSTFDGLRCVPSSEFHCKPPKPSAECEMRPSGMYQDLGSNCTRYFHCAGPLRTELACPAGQMFDGTRCTASASYVCPSQERDSCYGREDGRYRALGAGCRGYFVCVNGEKAIYACPPGQAFDGDACVSTRLDTCKDDFSCSGLSDGYHAEFQSNCRRYLYCEGGDLLTTLSCQGKKIFDGRACVDPSQHECGAPPRGSLENGRKTCERDGFYLQPGTDCRSYYFCLGGARTYLTCPSDQAFNGQVCVSRSQYTCPG